MKRALLINDSKFESIIMRDTLSLLGYNVRISDEYCAIKEVQTFLPDVVIVNYIMKEVFGDQMAAIIKMKDSNIKCMLYSNNPIDNDKLSYKKLDAVFQTPISQRGMERLMNRLWNGNI